MAKWYVGQTFRDRAGVWLSREPRYFWFGDSEIREHAHAQLHLSP
jgi:hypothetical protein